MPPAPKTLKLDQRTVSASEAVAIGTEHHHAGRLREAERIYRRVLEVDPENPDALHLLGVAAHQSGNSERAVQLISRAIDLQPRNPSFLNNRGEAFRVLRQPDQALADYNKALALKADDAGALFNRALVLQDLGRLDEALASYDGAISIHPGLTIALTNRGNVLHALRRLDEALASYDRALELRPDTPDTWCDRGILLQELRRYGDALASFDRLLAIRPDSGQAWASRGHALQGLKRFDEAIASYDKALAINPGAAEALSNRGNAMKELGRYDEALASYDAAIAIQPDDAAAHWNSSLILLLTGDYARGWKRYQWRWKWNAFPSPKRNFAQPLWLGDADIAGKTIFLHAEQGLGDTIMFCRYARAVAERGAKVVLEVQPALKPLLSNMPGAHQVLGQKEPLPDFDFHCPLLSLPLAFNTRLETIPPPVSFPSVRDAGASPWRGQLSRNGERLVGLCWRGSAAYKGDRERSIRFADLRPLLDCPGVRFVSLQKELGDEERAIAADSKNFVHPGADFKDTAELVAALDLVVSVDTSWAHWAGAIGRPVWVLLRKAPHWCWLLDRRDSPWYPSARLFRQARLDDWRQVIEDVTRELSRI